MLSRKHYRVIAKIINENTCEVEDTTWKVLDKDTLVNKLCQVFARDNSLFSRERFINACDDV